MALNACVRIIVTYVKVSKKEELVSASTIQIGKEERFVSAKTVEISRGEQVTWL